jgi:PLD-like domain
MKFKSRRIFKTANTGQKEIQELLQFIFIGEILSPGQRIWIVSPWISNVKILDNRTGLFTSIDPTWGKKEIRLIEILIRLMILKVEVILVTRPDEHCKRFFQEMSEPIENYGLQGQFKKFYREKLHTKGIMTAENLLTGSMNLTYNGLFLLDEHIIFDVDSKIIAQTRLNFEKYLGEEE